MKEQILQKLVDYLQRSEDFMLSECPIVIQQALRYHFISSLLGLIACITFLILSIGIFYYFYTNPTFDKYGTRELSCVLPLIISGIICAYSFIFTWVNADVLINICVAPKYFLINLFL